MTSSSEETSVPLIEPPVSSPISISFTNINYSIDQSISDSRWRMKSFLHCQSLPKKQILCNVTGCFTSGMNAILGKALVPSLPNFLSSSQDRPVVANPPCWIFWPIGRIVGFYPVTFESVVSSVRHTSNTLLVMSFKMVREVVLGAIVVSFFQM